MQGVAGSGPWCLERRNSHRTPACWDANAERHTQMKAACLATSSDLEFPAAAGRRIGIDGRRGKGLLQTCPATGVPDIMVLMHESTESLVSLRRGWTSAQTVDAIEAEAMRMYRQGWRYTGAHVDALLENVVLYFERNLST